MCVWDWERDYELVHAFVHAPVGLGSGEFMNVSFVGVGAVFGSLYACWCGALLFVWMLRQQGVMFMYIPFLCCVNVAATRGYVHVYPIPVSLGWGYVHEHFVNVLQWVLLMFASSCLTGFMNDTHFHRWKMRRAFAMQKLFHVIAKNMLKWTTRHTTGLPCKSPMKGVHNVQK